MKNLVDHRPKASSVMGVDCSSKKIAFAVLEDDFLKRYGAINLKGDDALIRTGDAARKMYAYFKLFKPQFVAIEGAVYVNNRKTVIKLANVAGAVLGAASIAGARGVAEVAPITWQSYIGNPLLTKAEKAAIKKETPDMSKSWYRKQNREFRKQRTMDIINERYGVTVEDDDVGDAIGVAIYAWEEITKR